VTLVTTERTEAVRPSAEQITADSARCVGAGQCVLTAPRVFDQDDLGIVVLLAERPSGAEESERVHEAVQLCPGRAITVGPVVG
jgi:ferredoxin